MEGLETAQNLDLFVIAHAHEDTPPRDFGDRIPRAPQQTGRGADGHPEYFKHFPQPCHAEMMRVRAGSRHPGKPSASRQLL